MRAASTCLMFLLLAPSMGLAQTTEAATEAQEAVQPPASEPPAEPVDEVASPAETQPAEKVPGIGESSPSQENAEPTSDESTVSDESLSDDSLTFDHFEPTFDWTVYSDVTFTIDDGPRRDPGGVESHPSFLIGGIDLFAHADLTADLDVLAEVMVMVMMGGDMGGMMDMGGGGSQAMIMVHPARLYARYRLWPELSFKIGRFHTILGYYLNHYPHGGRVFQLTIESPRLLERDMGRELLPTHTTGLAADGTLGIAEALDITYAVSVGNGTSDFGTDVNDWKSVSGRLVLVPYFLADGLEAGVSAYWNVLPKTDARKALDELIVAAHVAYFSYPIEATAEYFHVLHSPRSGGSTTNLNGFYVQLGWEVFDRFAPYARYEFFERHRDDPVFNDVNGPDRVNSVTGGIRLRLHEKNVIKIEYTYDIENRINRGAVQTAFSF